MSARRWALMYAGLSAVFLASVTAAAPPPTTAPALAKPYTAIPHSQNAEMYIRRRWGIDDVTVRSISSGSAVEFRYRVIDPNLAAVLNDTKAVPTLTDQKSGEKLVVPQMENVGALRQVSKPVAGKEYWMIFQDPKRVVKPKNRVDIAVGVLNLTGLTVE